MAMSTSNIKLGVAPINWTNDDLPELGAENTFEQCISEMALAGLEGCEVGNKYPRDTEVLKKALNLRKLQIANHDVKHASFRVEKTGKKSCCQK